MLSAEKGLLPEVHDEDKQDEDAEEDEDEEAGDPCCVCQLNVNNEDVNHSRRRIQTTRR